MLPAELPVQSLVKQVVVKPVAPVGAAAALLKVMVDKPISEMSGVAEATLLAGMVVKPISDMSGVGWAPLPKVAQLLKNAVEVLKRLNELGNLFEGSCKPPKAANSASRPMSKVAPTLASAMRHTPPAVLLEVVSYLSTSFVRAVGGDDLRFGGHGGCKLWRRKNQSSCQASRQERHPARH